MLLWKEVTSDRAVGWWF